MTENYLVVTMLAVVAFGLSSSGWSIATDTSGRTRLQRGGADAQAEQGFRAVLSRNVIGCATGDETLIDHDLLVDPVCPGGSRCR